MGKALKKLSHLFDPIDMTQGKIGKGMLYFSIPIILTLLFQQIYILVDAMIVGQTLDSDAVAGVNNSSMSLAFFIFFSGGLAAAFSAVTGKRNGHKDYEGVRKCLTNHIYLVVIISALLSLIGNFCIVPLLNLLGINGDVAPAMFQNAYNYMQIVLFGIVALMLFSTVIGELQGLGNAFGAFVFYVASTLLNIGLDYLFILVFGWGVRGAAAATVLAQLAVGLSAYAYLFIRYPQIRPGKKDWGFDGIIVWSSLKTGIPMALSSSVSAAGIVIMQGMVVSFDFTAAGEAVSGYPAQLGYGVARNVVNFLCVPLSAVGQTTLFFQSQNRGKRDYERIKKGFRFSLLYGGIAYLFILVAGLLVSINGAYQYIFLSDDKITAASIAYGNAYMYVAIPSSVFLMVIYVCRNALLGWEKPLFTSLSGAGELIARILVSLFLPLAFTGGVAVSSSAGIYAFGGLCLADSFSWFFGGVIIMLIPCIYYLRHTDKLKRKPGKKELERKAREAAEKAALEGAVASIPSEPAGIHENVPETGDSDQNKSV